MMHVLIVEDEASIADTLVFALRNEGFEVSWVTLGQEALRRLASTDETIDLVILDVGLPDMNGFEVCKVLRRFSELPVMFLTARDAEIDRVVGLEIGADDYVVKPFSPREVTARVKAILKRLTISERAKASSSLFQVDVERFRISYHCQPLTLTPHEFHLLNTLLSRPGRVFSREQLLDALGVSADAGYERNIDSHIKTLRAKLRQVDPQSEPIQTHRGLGYSYSPENS